MFELSSWIAEWSVANTMSTALLSICVQLCLLAVVAMGAVRCIASIKFRTAKSAPTASTAYTIWLATACLLILVGPVQLLTGGLPVHIASKSTGNKNTQLQTGNPSANSISEQRLLPDDVAQAESSVFPRPDLVVNDNAAQFVTPLQRTAATLGQSVESSIEHSSTTARSSPKSPFLKRSYALWLLIAIYVTPVVWMLLQLTVSTAQLAGLASNGRLLSPSEMLVARQAASQLQINTLPEIRSVDIRVPMACGLLKPIVLVPCDFSTWPEQEQRTVFLHEFAHVLRRDTWGEVLAQLIQAIYWFHPASWFVALRLRKTRVGYRRTCRRLWSCRRPIRSRSSVRT